VVFESPARHLPARAFLPTTLSLARRAGQWQAGPSRSGPARRMAGGRYLSQGIGHDRIHAIVYTFSNQYTILPALMNDTKELRSVFVEAIREDFLGHLLFCHKLRNNPYLWQGTSLPLRKQAHISSGKHLLRSLLS